MRNNAPVEHCVAEAFISVGIKVKNIKEAIFPATSDARNPKGVKDVRDNDQRYDQTFDGYGPALHQRPFDRTAYKPSPYLPYAGRIAVVWSFRRR